MRRRGVRVFAGSLACIALFVSTGTAVGAGPPAVHVLLDGSPVSTLRAAVINGVLYFPLRALVAAMRATLVVGPDLEIRRADGRTFVVRAGRREVWSGSVVTAVAEAPALVVNGVTMVPSAAVEAIFDALVVWNSGANTAAIITRSTFRPAEPDGPPSRRVSTPLAPPPRPFVPEFQPSQDRPVAASGVVGVVVSTGAGSGLSISSRLAFASRGGDAAVAGAFGIGARTNAPAAADGLVTWRRGPAMVSAGTLSMSESPLTLYEQGFVGLIYDQRFGPIQGRFFGGVLSGANVTVYGTSFRLSPIGALLPEVTVLYSPETNATIVRGRMDWRMGSGWSLFGEAAHGTSSAGFGTGWRIGTQHASHRWTVSLGYLAVSPGFPAMGNAAVFAGRHGPAVDLAYHPNAQVFVLASAVLLSGPSDSHRRLAYRMYMQYRISSSWAIVGEVHSTDRPESGVRVRRETAQAALLYTSGRWSAALLVSHGLHEQVGQPAAIQTSVSLGAGYFVRTGWHLWGETGQLLGARRGWTLRAGTRVQLTPALGLTAQLRAKTLTWPSPSREGSVELGVVRPLASGAELSIGAGMTIASSPGSSTMATPYVTIGYARRFTVFGPLKAGRLEAVVFVDASGDGRRDVEEAGVAGVVIRINGQTASRTDADGRAVVEGVGEGAYRVTVDEHTIPVGFVAVAADARVHIAADGRTVVSFPLVRAATLRCLIYLDENGSGVRDPGELGVPDVGVILMPVDRRTTTDLDGALVFADLKPGTYTVALDPRGLPETVKLGEITTFTAGLAAGATVACELPVLSARGVIRTFP